ncbi:hypothetical protein IE53DRAFT_296124, partial [Violaceomyces palustris]
ISSLSPKPCRTCGRMITPRAKWSKNWEEIKFCSDGCRNQRPDKARVDWTLQGEASISRFEAWLESEGTIKLSVELERWTEVCLLYVAVNGPALATCEDVEAKLKFDLEELLTSVAEFQDAEGDREGKGSGQVRELSPAKVREHPFKDNPLWKGLDATPGLRERVRRAARRIKVFGECESQATLGTREPPFEMGRVKLELVQKGRRLETLQDLSLAKGPIELRA